MASGVRCKPSGGRCKAQENAKNPRPLFTIPCSLFTISANILKMKTYSSPRSVIVATSIIAILLAFVGYLYFHREYEVNKLPDNREVKLLKNALTEEIRVINAETKQTLFRYSDGYGIVLQDVQKLPNGEWKIVIRDLNQSNDNVSTTEAGNISSETAILIMKGNLNSRMGSDEYDVSVIDRTGYWEVRFATKCIGCQDGHPYGMIDKKTGEILQFYRYGEPMKIPENTP